MEGENPTLRMLLCFGLHSPDRPLMIAVTVVGALGVLAHELCAAGALHCVQGWPWQRGRKGSAAVFLLLLCSLLPSWALLGAYASGDVLVPQWTLEKLNGVTGCPSTTRCPAASQQPSW